MTQRPAHLVTTSRAARELAIDRSTITRWHQEGRVQPAWVTPGGHARWDLDDLRRQLGIKPTEDRPEDRPIVAAAVVTSDHGVLIAQRRDGTPPWTLPAGELQPGETPAAAAVREVGEETGLAVEA